MAAYRAAIIVYMALVLCSCSLLPRAVEADTDCTTALMGLKGCAAFLTNPSTTPDNKTCCAPLEEVLTTPSSFQCLCAQASSSQSQAFKNALLLPQSCKLSITISEANCTQSPPSSKTPATSTTPVTSTTPGSRSPSAGTMSASPLAPLLAMALLCAVVSSFA